MNPFVEQTLTIFRKMTLVQKVSLITAALIMAAGFVTLFVWVNRVTYKAAWTGLTEEDASSIVASLKETNVPYRIEAGGSAILVPEKEVYDVRLALARQGIPKGGGVGYEIFDQTDFGTTEFVQKINRVRALQGELARTIRAFDEVKDARVMIVLPKDSVFVEETKEPSASVLLDLMSDLDEEKVAAVAHLVASSVEDLTPKLVTIVDTAGRILFEGKSDEEKARIEAKNLVESQYQYKLRYETTLAEQIQTMLERIVGKDKAIVRVTAEMDFSTSNMSEEIFDPYERETTFVRSQKNLAESAQNAQDPREPSSVNPVVPPGGQAATEAAMAIQKQNDTVNYEISRRMLQTVKPMAVLERLSVAAVVDGKYEVRTDDTGNRVRTYIPRSQAEMQQFRDIVVKAMGFSETRQDQVTAECFPFASIDELGTEEPEESTWRMVQREYGRLIANSILVLLLFLFVVRPLLKTARGIKAGTEPGALPHGGGVDMIEGGMEDSDIDFADMTPEQQREYLKEMSPAERQAFLESMTPRQKKVYFANMTPAERAQHYARLDMNKTANILKAWVTETEESQA